MAKKKRKKYPNLPAGFGTIRYLGPGRRNCYAVHPPAKVNELGKTVRPPAICYVDDYVKGFAVLTAYKAGTYQPGMERELEIAPTTDADALLSRILADYNTIKGVEDKHPEIKKLTFTEVYEQFWDWKFSNGKLSKSSKQNYAAAFKNCKKIHERIFEDLKAPEMQEILDNCPLKHASIELILNLFKQMYKYAIFAEIVSDNKSQYLRITASEDDQHGVPFTEENLKTLWEHSSDPEVQMILIMCYSGWRINELVNLEINLKEKYFRGGSKTNSGKNRIVPIHSCIYEFVKKRVDRYECLIPYTTNHYRTSYFCPTLEKLGIIGNPRHTPHDCRHTFSMLCEKYGVMENDRKRMLGHSFGGDVTNSVYGHRTLKELCAEIEKIKVPFVTNCD